MDITRFARTLFTLFWSFLTFERYDFILHASQNVDSYWFHATPQNAVRNNGFALIRYEGAPNSDPPRNVTDRSGIVYQDWDVNTSNKVLTVDQLKRDGKYNFPSICLFIYNVLLYVYGL